MNRKTKDFLIKKYFDFRINTTELYDHIRFRKYPYKFLFLFSHMRSGSSLLTHLIINNPEVIGYGETHLCYKSTEDLKKLLYNVYEKVRSYQMNEIYVLDKILHNQRLQNNDFLSSQSIKTIFLLREPKATINSLLILKPHWTSKEASNYYCGRLLTLVNYAQSINDRNRCLFITYEQIIDQSQSVLDKLQNYLNTKEEFSEQYQVTRITGLKGIGDSSSNIKSGKIIKKSPSKQMEIDHDSLNRAIASFSQTSETLSQYCQTIKDNL
ncbi:hypothetical protein Cyast_1136 [Cyanobacterium stanieri PCC 7202]|uniref:Uncharacterized protein n=1 Tax=Cyanobacterium stanieri (strain ATCC 29140 / PCC 7202) TaxID=292563 RepID=K9YLX9_CYASC|nr:hypothetical protein Cyast_1136 [Cyanobacterium stanieri PCC 7202]